VPRQTDIFAESKALEKALQKGDTSVRQYAVRITLPTSVQLLRDCCRQNRLPALVLKDLIEDYYGKWSGGVHAELPDLHRQLLDRLAELLQCDREKALLFLIERGSDSVFQAARTERDKLKTLLGPEAAP
jgi:hypothetical protein